MVVAKEKITYYLCDFNGRLSTREKKIYSPYNTITIGRSKQEDTYRNPDYVIFKNGIFELDPDTVSDTIYEQRKEWLGFFNPQGGKLSKGIGESASKNGTYWRGDVIHIIKTELNQDKSKDIIVKEESIVSQIPLKVAEMLTVKQLQAFAKEIGVELPTDFGTKEPNDIKNTIIKELQIMKKISE